MLKNNWDLARARTNHQLFVNVLQFVAFLPVKNIYENPYFLCYVVGMLWVLKDFYPATTKVKGDSGCLKLIDLCENSIYYAR